MNRPALLGVDGAFVVDRLAENVEDAAQGLSSDRDGDRPAGVDRLHAAHHAVGRLHGDAPNDSFTDVVRHFGDDIDVYLPQLAFVDDADAGVDRRQVAFLELDVDGWSDDLDDASDGVVFRCFV